MKIKKSMLCVGLIIALVSITLFGCSENDSTNTNQESVAQTTSNEVNKAETSVPQFEMPKVIEATATQKLMPEYVAIGDVSEYDHMVITDMLLANRQLPAASKNHVPYYTGFVLENKISINYGNDKWAQYTPGQHYFIKDELKKFSEDGFNAIRVLYSMSFLSNPDDIMQVNGAELKQLDELISWALEYNLHVMLSITGLPGKAGTSWEEENVQQNSAVFTDTATEAIFSKYWAMLSKRYASLPSDVISFELMAEPEVPNADTSLYTKVLSPIAQNMWQDNPERIVIANDVSKNVPEGLAAIGCDLSLHTHIYTVSEERLENFGITFDAKWPMQYLPGSLNSQSGTLTLKSDNGFKKGSISVAYEYYNKPLEIQADDKVIAKSEGPSMMSFSKIETDFPEGTREITLTPRDDASIVAVTLNQDYENPITIPTHSLYGVYVANEPLPTMLVGADGSITDVDSPPYQLDADYFASRYLKPFTDVAQKYGVSFLMTEVGTDTTDLSPEEYIAYHGEWLKALKAQNISWMYNTVHNILAPKPLMWLSKANTEFTEFTATDIPNYEENTSVMDLLKAYQ